MWPPSLGGRPQCAVHLHNSGRGRSAVFSIQMTLQSVWDSRHPRLRRISEGPAEPIQIVRLSLMGNWQTEKDDETHVVPLRLSMVGSLGRVRLCQVGTRCRLAFGRSAPAWGIGPLRSLTRLGAGGRRRPLEGPPGRPPGRPAPRPPSWVEAVRRRCGTEQRPPDLAAAAQGSPKGTWGYWQDPDSPGLGLRPLRLVGPVTVLELPRRSLRSKGEPRHAAGVC